MFECFDIETKSGFYSIDGIATEFAQNRCFPGIVETENENSKLLLLLFNLNNMHWNDGMELSKNNERWEDGDVMAGGGVAVTR